ncbi:ABC transporter ATP-binding protein [Ideonella sp. 4Y11]|uniref:ABC transporter ATP-binding protein n=1 Tax=Ideonella aquatica TaxID=2824119 RepID=A0A940YNS8_9BURK|nr:ATP-binding cassette domain-containing protein [Ideonella aquatica]MBQ0961281.1 ABC transporter ATP-binding protein [Ideonella aquatica]
MNAPLIELKDVSRRHDSGVLALDGLDLRLARGERVALLGLAGSGKSSLLRLLAGIDRPLAGAVLRQGEPLRGTQADAAFVFSSPALMPWASAAVNVELPLRLQGSAAPAETREQRAREALAAVGLEALADVLPKALDESQRMGVALARAWVVQPALLLLDDWLSQVSPAARPGLRRVLAEAARTTAAPACVLATRDVDEALLHANRVLVLGGRPGRVLDELRLDTAVPREPAWLETPAGQRARKRLLEALSSADATA